MNTLLSKVQLSLLLAVFTLIFPKEGHGDSLSSTHCGIAVTHYETRHNIPAGLLHAISKVESGVKNKGTFQAWPWTVNADGRGYYFPTKEAAIAAVRTLQAKGTRKIDVGCMQVNLYHHPHAFQTLEDAFDPEKNVKYAALFLKRLKETYTSWERAVSHYHSANPVHHIPYQKAVFSLWKKEGKASSSICRLETSLGRVHRMRRLPMVQEISFRTNPPSSHPGVRRVTRSLKYQKRI